MGMIHGRRHVMTDDSVWGAGGAVSDRGENQGGFQWFFHRDFDAWVKTQPADRDPLPLMDLRSSQ